MSNPVISTTSQRRTIVGTLAEAFDIARTQMADVDAWAGASISINPVMRDHSTGFYMWEVMVSGVAMTFGTQEGQTIASPHESATPLSARKPPSSVPPTS